MVKRFIIQSRRGNHELDPFEGQERRTICAVRDILHPYHKRNGFITSRPIDLELNSLRQRIEAEA